MAIAAPAVAETGYFAQIPDLPMPAGFTETSRSLSFDGGEGRIIVAHAEGEADRLAVRDFYYDALPQLGWSVNPQMDGTLVFQRGRERLSFTVETVNGRTILGARLMVAPALANGD